MNKVQLIVGLGNPGTEYQQTRHNAGAWLVEQLAARHAVSLKPESKFHGLTARIQCGQQDCRLVIPTTYMNRSGQSVSALCNFFKIEPESVLVAHDELDLPPGQARLKRNGGHGGHNGLRDIIQHFSGNKNFLRLRIGIGHPGEKNLVSNFVLSNPAKTEKSAIDCALDESLRVIDAIIAGDLDKAMQQLHSATK